MSWDIDKTLALVPSILEYIRSFNRNEGRLPTVQEMREELSRNTDKYIQAGEQWLKDHQPQDGDLGN